MNTEAYNRYRYYWTGNGRGEVVCRLVDDIDNPHHVDPRKEKLLLEVVCRDDDLNPPAAIRSEYERLIEWKAGDLTGEPFNIVELMTAGENEGGGFNQLCMYGHLVEGHSVYCHNTEWLYSPRKCRRTWYTGGQRRDEDCEGYKPNPNYRPT